MPLEAFPWDPIQHPDPVTVAFLSYGDDALSDWLIDLNDILEVSLLHPPVTYPSHTAPVFPSKVVIAP